MTLTKFPFKQMLFTAAMLVAKMLEVIVLVIEVVSTRLCVVVVPTREVSMAVTYASQ